MGGVDGRSPDATGIFEENSEESEAIERPAQRGVEVDSSRYYETGAVAVGIGADGLPVVGGGAPQGPDEGLTVENLICNAAPGRPACEHYTAIITPADGVAKGYGRELRQIRRFCSRLQTASELWEIDGRIFACSARRPRDERSAAEIEQFEAQQKEIARDMSETGGKLDF